MRIIGRLKELQILNRLYQSSEPQFLALYGRRRIGKTFLVKHFAENQTEAIFFNVTGVKDGSLKEQTQHFTQRIGEVFYGGAPLAQVKNWDKSFALLTEAIKQQASSRKIILFFDELPWMATQKSNLLQTIDYYWNQYWSNDPRIILIICGSSASWIIKKIIRSTVGLHNRITEEMLLQPFNLHDTQKYLESRKIILDRKQILLLYMVTGGVPYYLSKINWNLSAMQIVEKLAFSKNAFFLNEFKVLFSSLFHGHEVHEKIVKALAKNRYGLSKNDLLKLIGSQGGNGGAKLQELEDAGFILSFKPIYHRRKGIYYRLIDEYVLFYLKWIEPIEETLSRQALDLGDWQAIRTTPEWYNWLGYAFESVCYKHLILIKRKLALPPMSLANSWRTSASQTLGDRGAQIDLLFDRRDDVINICEIKYTEKPFVITQDYFETLNRKMAVFKEKTGTQKQLFLSFISANGLKDNAYSHSISGVVTLEDLFQAEG